MGMLESPLAFLSGINSSLTLSLSSLLFLIPLTSQPTVKILTNSQCVSVCPPLGLFQKLMQKDTFVIKFDNLHSCHYLSNRKFFRVCIACYKHERGWENSRQSCKPETKSRVNFYITVENFPNTSSVYIRLCKHRKKVFYCFYKKTFPRKSAKLFVWH